MCVVVSCSLFVLVCLLLSVVCCCCLCIGVCRVCCLLSDDCRLLRVGGMSLGAGCDVVLEVCYSLCGVCCLFALLLLVVCGLSSGEYGCWC